MKKIFVLFLTLILICSLTACFDDATSQSSAPSETQSSESGQPSNVTMNDEGDIGDYHIKIGSAKKGTDHSQRNVIIVTYEWTNNSDSDHMFSTVFQAKAFQNGVECSDITVVAGVDAQNLLSNISPGATLEVQKAYILNDTGNITVEVTPWLSSGSDVKVIKIFSLG